MEWGWLERWKTDEKHLENRGLFENLFYLGATREQLGCDEAFLNWEKFEGKTSQSQPCLTYICVCVCVLLLKFWLSKIQILHLWISQTSLLLLWKNGSGVQMALIKRKEYVCPVSPEEGQNYEVITTMTFSDAITIVSLPRVLFFVGFFFFLV